MPHDLIDDPLQSQYRATAEKLSSGAPVGDAEMRVFLGVTGLMQARTMEMLWTQAELDKQIDARVTAAVGAHKAECKGDANIHGTAGNSRDNWGAIATAFAANMKTAIITVGVVTTIVLVLIVATRQISEAGGFVKDAATAASN